VRNFKFVNYYDSFDGTHPNVFVSGDIHNGKIWDVSTGRADYYDKYRPKLVITFGKPGVTYSSPISVGSTKYTSVATTSSKNKLTNGTFRYGTVEGTTNTTYWHADPAALYINNQNIYLMQKAGDVNPKTGSPALRFMCVADWKWIRQMATGLTGSKTYTFSGWYKGSASGIKADVRLEFQDASGKALGSGQAVYSGSGNWEQVKLTKTAPSGTVKAKIELVNWTSGSGAYMLYSNLQLEEGSSVTTYSETMGTFYPDYPRTDSTGTVPSPTVQTPSVKLTMSADKTTSVPATEITYTISYTNAGPGEARSVVITAPIPANTTYVAGSATSSGTLDSAGGKVTWTIPSVAAGASGSVMYKVKVN
jgi:uncharacterized repeat protein (TIGR01451 family)